MLVVEPDPTSVDVEFDLADDFELLLARDLRGALALIGEREDEICAIVSGALVPTASGLYQHPKTLWLRLPRAARIVVSPDAETTRQAYAARASAVVQEPWSAGALLDVVQWTLTQAVSPLTPPEPDAVVRSPRS